MQAGRLPFIRMMPRSDVEENRADLIYTLQAIIDGKFDIQLIQWALEAKLISSPLLVEFGTEMNGDWFPWSWLYNGGGQNANNGDPQLADGPERFRDAYRRIIALFRSVGVTNITWFFHVNA
ncbi:MAG: beta-mannanase, partial [Gammaproteobacteria bacterium]|nr:beta-mannanase [Gammaproteobacteria bacterium]